MVKCAIALGSNLGDSKEILNQALEILAQTSGIELISHSSWYETVPVGPPQPNYVNGCATLETELLPDILLYDDLILEMQTLTIPHPRMNERAFVLVPLAEIAPHWIEPLSGQTILQLSQAIDCSGIINRNSLLE
jgi:2-amino-4-hydroxy-6-hydroxymethyldihydropteridine diphosphokinase